MKIRKLSDHIIAEEKDFSLKAEVSENGIKLVNVKRQYPHTFEFNNSKPELIQQFGKAMQAIAKYAKEK